MSGEQAIFNLHIKKKSGLCLNPDIPHSKVFSSGDLSPDRTNLLMEHISFINETWRLEP